MKEHLIEILENLRDRDLNVASTPEELEDLEKCLKVVCTDGFKDPAFKKFMSVISKRPFELGMQTLVGNMVYYFNDKGFETPCANGCNEDCALHEIEFGDI